MMLSPLHPGAGAARVAQQPDKSPTRAVSVLASSNEVPVTCAVDSEYPRQIIVAAGNKVRFPARQATACRGLLGCPHLPLDHAIRAPSEAYSPLDALAGAAAPMKHDSAAVDSRMSSAKTVS